MAIKILLLLLLCKDVSNRSGGFETFLYEDSLKEELL